MDLTSVAAAIGALTGPIALVWRLYDQSLSYLRISIKVEIQHGCFLSAVTSVDNSGRKAKKVQQALLLVGPEKESPLETARLLGYPANWTNDLVSQCESIRATFDQDGRYITPLDYYFSENLRVGDETLTYRVPIPSDNIPRGVPYSARFFVGAPPRLHRSNHDCFLLPEGWPGACHGDKILR